MMTPLSPDFELLRLAETSSTNDEARRLAGDGGGRRFRVVLADYQTAGRGQRGNAWEAERGRNLLFSVLVHPRSLRADRQFMLSEVASLAVCTALEGMGTAFRVKWPNDVYCNGRKVCGMLIENKLKGAMTDYSIAGIGINVNQKAFLSGAPNPVSLLQITGHEVDREQVFADVLNQYRLFYTMLEEGRCDELKEAWFSRLFRADGRMHDYEDGRGAFRACIEDVEDDGCLVLRDEDNRLRRYAFKEVRCVFQNGVCL